MTKLTDAAAMAAALFLAPGLLFAASMPVEQAPAGLREIAESYAPGATFTKVEREVEAGRDIYEFIGTKANGRRIEIDLYADGTLDEIEMEEATADLPPAVTATLERAAPGAEIVFVETSVHGDGRFFYEVELRLRSGERVAYEVSESGDIVSVESSTTS